jgi:hypothetical protein
MGEDYQQSDCSRPSANIDAVNLASQKQAFDPSVLGRPQTVQGTKPLRGKAYSQRGNLA